MRMSEREHGPTEEDEYNGYTNYPTWAVHLWLANTEASYFQSQRLLARAGEPVRGAEVLQSWVESQNPITEGSMYAELLVWALQAVDWDMVARALGPEEWEDSHPAAPVT